MYFMPQHFGGRECMCPCSTADIDACIRQVGIDYDNEDADCFELFMMVLVENGWTKPSGASDMIDLYVLLRNELCHLLL